VASFLKKTVASRLAGDRPSPVKAAVVAAVAGIAVAALTYQALRS
jgi:hypothetical protein